MCGALGWYPVLQFLSNVIPRYESNTLAKPYEAGDEGGGGGGGLGGEGGGESEKYGYTMRKNTSFLKKMHQCGLLPRRSYRQPSV